MRNVYKQVTLISYSDLADNVIFIFLKVHIVFAFNIFKDSDLILSCSIYQLVVVELLTNLSILFILKQKCF